MSIEVINLTKVFGQQKAVNDVSFSIQKGEIVGFLGPNGAGKSTTMKIICAYLPPTQGTVKVNGLDVETQALEVKKKIGYLPESNPLYMEMYVKEYLQFAARITGLKQKSQRIKDTIELTGLGLEQNKKIGALSKGYKQRLGLAQAILHEPEVLILDEPTSGLDPNQLIEIRKLIKDLGKEKTVLFSSHIMQEVQALCDKIIIIDQGVIKAYDTTENIKNSFGGHQNIQISFSQSVNEKTLLTAIPQINEIKKTSSQQFQLISQSDIRLDLFKFAQTNGLHILELVNYGTGLEDVFRKITDKTNSSEPSN